MNILVIGLGSMGKRRIRILLNHFGSNTIVGVDTKGERREYCEKDYGIETVASLEEAFDKYSYSVSFVCTSPISHSSIISECLRHGSNVFTEINLVSDGYDDNMELAKKMDLNLFMSSTPIYRDEMQYLYKKISNTSEKVCYSYHVGQYLPDWHPWENYKDFFVGDKRTNGCREIMAIELPWISRVFGEIVEVNAVKRRLLTLDLDYSDCYVITLCHRNGSVGTFIADVVARNPIRDLKIIGENTYITWTGEPDSLYSRNDEGQIEQVILYEDVEHNSNYNRTIVENEYVNEMQQFFAELEGTRDSVYTFADDKLILDIIDSIEQE